MEKIKKFDDKCIIVRIPIGIQHRKNLFEATRRCWRASLIRAKKAKYVLGTIDREILCVIRIKNCDYLRTEFCNNENKKCKGDFNVNIELCKKSRRIAFEGEELKNDTKYLHKTIPEKYFPKQNPVRYTYG